MYKKSKKKGMLQKVFEQMVEDCVSYVSESNNQAKIHTTIIGPTMTYLFQQFYPYLIAFMIFVLNFVLTIILLILCMSINISFYFIKLLL